jgi:selenocysteine lyase/cysteine desulfurase
VAAHINASIDEVLLVSNATTGTNTILRGMQWKEGDVIVFFETVYGALEKTIDYIVETTPATSHRIEIEWPVEDDVLLQKFSDTVQSINASGRNVRLATFDTIVSMPGVRVPFEALTQACKNLNVLSMVDGAHGIGHIPLDMKKLRPDFFTSNLHKWLYVPRGCAVLYIDNAHQDLIRSTLPTSHGFIPLPKEGSTPPINPHTLSGVNPFTEMFEFIGTLDNSNYFCVPAALKFRQEVCGGEQAIMDYCLHVVREGGNKAAKILGTEIMDNSTGTARDCAFTNIRLPLTIGEGDGQVSAKSVALVMDWIQAAGLREYDTYFAIRLYRGNWWVRFSGQIYLEVEDFVWGADKLKILCERVSRGEHMVLN